METSCYRRNAYDRCLLCVTFTFLSLTTSRMTIRKCPCSLGISRSKSPIQQRGKRFFCAIRLHWGFHPAQDPLPLESVFSHFLVTRMSFQQLFVFKTLTLQSNFRFKTKLAGKYRERFPISSLLPSHNLALVNKYHSSEWYLFF